MPVLRELISVLEKLAPPHLAESWDNVGLLVGSREQEINKVLCALDLNEEVVDEAIACGANCIVTHHPFLFRPIKSVDLDTAIGHVIGRLIRENIALYTLHTNYDIATGGLNDYLCQGLGLREVAVLKPTHTEAMYKCEVYVPVPYKESVREAIIKANPYVTECYTGCTFTTAGEGTFMPLEDARPFVGQVGELEKVEEVGIRFITRKSAYPIIREAIEKVHPYERVAYDVIELENIILEEGIGRVGTLQEPLDFISFIEQVKQYFGLDQVRVSKVVGNPIIQRVAICSGSGAEYIEMAAQRADIYITGDLRFHEAQLAYSLGIPVIDVGHYASENRALEPIRQVIHNLLESCEVMTSQVNGEMLFTK